MEYNLDLFYARIADLLIPIKDNDYTDKQIAHEIGMPPQTFNTYVKGKREPKATSIVQLAHYFGVSTDYLLGLTDVKSTSPELKEACEYTGLSDETVKILHSDCFTTSGYSLRETVDYFIESESLLGIYFLDDPNNFKDDSFQDENCSSILDICDGQTRICINRGGTKLIFEGVFKSDIGKDNVKPTVSELTPKYYSSHFTILDMLAAYIKTNVKKDKKYCVTELGEILPLEYNVGLSDLVTIDGQKIAERYIIDKLSDELKRSKAWTEK